MKDFQPISALLLEHLQRADDPPAEATAQSKLMGLWDRCAGRAAAFTYPILFYSGRLVIFTESPIWATEIRHNLEQIRNGTSALGVTNIDVRTSPKLIPVKPSPIPNLRVSERNRQGIEVCAHRLKHAGLREAMNRLSRGGEDNSDAG